MLLRSFHFGLCVLLQILNAEVSNGACVSGNITHLNASRGTLNASNSSCTWMVTIPDGKLIMLKILNFSSVQDAVLQIRDGQNSSMKHLETFREDDIIGEKTLVFSYIQLWIQVNSSLEKDILFLAVFEAVDKFAVRQCVGQKEKLFDIKGRILWPLFPTNSSSSINCSWLITVPEGRFVKIKLKKLRSYPSDSLSIRDGQHSSNRSLDKICPVEPTTNLFSSGRFLLIEFTSNNTTENGIPGFDAVFEALKQFSKPPLPCTSRECHEKQGRSEFTGEDDNCNHPDYDNCVNPYIVCPTCGDNLMDCRYCYLKADNKRNCRSKPTHSWRRRPWWHHPWRPKISAKPPTNNGEGDFKFKPSKKGMGEAVKIALYCIAGGFLSFIVICTSYKCIRCIAKPRREEEEEEEDTLAALEKQGIELTESIRRKIEWEREYREMLASI
ncbi:tolloid-like protein 2 isoform X1 [Montipora capricornis]|uniref:tolloid-like protein 2 isoform X1 n=1 Tax=Montipora capricornis TaxID=246305 RepID=UPI0035F121F5